MLGRALLCSCLLASGVTVFVPACGGAQTETPKAEVGAEAETASDAESEGGVGSETGADDARADVIEVSASGEAGAYTFAVTLRSPDTGCERYADWWELANADGSALHYRRILAHSHVDEQPFTRSGGPVELAADAEIVVRAHMNTGGYGQAMAGSVGGGFELVELEADWGAALEELEPQPESCAF